MLPSRHLLIRSDKGDALSLHFLLRLTDSSPASSSSLSLHGRFSLITSLSRLSLCPCVLITPRILSPTLLHLSRLSANLLFLIYQSLASVPPTLLLPRPVRISPLWGIRLDCYVCLCVCVFIKLHIITAQPGPDKCSSFYATRIEPSLWGISDCYRHDIF